MAVRLSFFRRMFRCLAVAWAVGACGLGQAHPVLEGFAQLGVSPDHVAWVVWPTDAAEPISQHNPQQSMPMASVAKLVTSMVALDTLGPRHRWRTRVYAQGALYDRTLHGDLVLVGGGDPRLTSAELRTWFASLQAAGLQRIQGHIVLQRGLFQLTERDHEGTPTPASDRPHHQWPDAFTVDEGVLQVEGQPQADRVLWQMQPPLDGVVVQDLTQRKAGRCGALRRPLSIRLEEVDRPIRVVVEGDWAPGCALPRLGLSTPPGSRFAALAVAAAWKDAGGVLDGLVVQPARSWEPPVWAPGTRPLDEFTSPPLHQWLRDMNKWSNNLMARHLMLAWSPGFPNQPARMAAARQRFQAWARQRGLGSADLQLDNGSGLSRGERARPIALARLLQKAWKGPHRQLLVGSLPVAGQDGTLSGRLTALKGRAHLKTGTLNDVRSLAGFVKGQGGRTFVVVGVVQDPQAPKAAAALDALIEWTAAQP
ncbi:D-alanyl-D-alanine carboxypeptidase/D-alanyl-D-alanine-endopeptidase [Aquabacterium lacunae]|uniref:D-alanyl-D-alanine carboxypeptidase/D-alanyl-D-alanine-endopeptidase n=1 Tax=Aquabacterium lacunae TaxID=2528630 RepID=A0A4Q9H392_9BURK|nr:D-alanyl-D-alanine carboxypeptidase/D-alanyl-D-alanine-endopeptidase [Aquabacterium lacunae]TBO33951.1 D-alanyl-D-alanine carboxypeptidase/D-alanyl-D-alanine-endopeptidase [Aquabacterium lacunae]